MTFGSLPDTHSVGLRLVRRTDPAITDVTVDHAPPGRDDAARFAAAAASAARRRRQFGEPGVTTNRERESLALAMMVDELSRDPGNLLQRLVEVVIGLLGVSAAAVAMIDGSPLRWDAAAGPMADSPRWTAFHRAVVARRVAELQARVRTDITGPRPTPQSAPYLEDAQAIPLQHEGAMVGMLWVANRHGGAMITPDDQRVVRVMAQLASSAWTTWARGDAARRASSRKSELLATVSHELRNPLGTIATAAALLRDRGPGRDDDTTAIDVIMRQCQFMSRVVTDLFDTARLDHGKLDLQLASIDVRAMVVETMASRRQQLERQGHTLSLDLGEAPLCVAADPVRLVQILSNLIDNAIKYTARGGRIVVSLRRRAGDVRLTVEDTGDGLPADQLVGIFEPFAQLDGATRVGGGLGLGLPLARRLAELHGGSLHATSPGLGQGSSFVVTLPADTRQQLGAGL